MMPLFRLAPGLAVLLIAGCDTSRPAAPAPEPDAGLSFRDSRAADQAAPRPDAGCSCPAGRVWMRGPCVPTMQLDRCAPSCDPASPTSCGKGLVCDRWAAAPSCIAAAALPACVPGQAMAFPWDTLRISPTSAVAGKAVTLTVEGGMFYVGALHWLISLGDISSGPVTQGGACQLRATFVPSKPGVYPVLVGYGGKPWVLAGFFTASGGSAPPKWVQPGFVCNPGDTCASAPGYTCACHKGFCNCSQ